MSVSLTTPVTWHRTTLAEGERIGAEERAARSANPGFGNVFTEHMASVRWSAERGWYDAQLLPYGPLPMQPGMAGLHYGQSIFEGMKVFRLPGGEVSIFRWAEHARRLRNSARRLHMPEVPPELFRTAIEELVRADRDWVPAAANQSLYLRPVLYAEEHTVALRPATEYRLLVLAFVLSNIFDAADRGVSVWAAEQYTRAARGGAGEAKCGGNYAPSYLAQSEAAEHGCQQVIWLDAAEHRWVEEMGGMNVFLVRRAGDRDELVTPPLTGTILPGVTRASLLTLAADLGLGASERRIGLRQWQEEVATGVVREAFACGTGAGVTSISRVVTATDAWPAGAIPAHPVTERVRAALTEAQRGSGVDRYGWRHIVD